MLNEKVEEKLFNNTPLKQGEVVDLADIEFGKSASKLLDYQVIGVRWLMEAWDSQKNVILADEMGLGKTV